MKNPSEETYLVVIGGHVRQTIVHSCKTYKEAQIEAIRRSQEKGITHYIAQNFNRIDPMPVEVRQLRGFELGPKGGWYQSVKPIRPDGP